MIILYAFLVLSCLGLLLGFGLCFASEKFHVEEDSRIEDIAGMLPNANCGACGYPGCKGFAEALIDGKEKKLSTCKVGKPENNFNPIIAYLAKHKDEQTEDIDV